MTYLSNMTILWGWGWDWKTAGNIVRAKNKLNIYDLLIVIGHMVVTSLRRKAAARGN